MMCWSIVVLLQNDVDEERDSATRQQTGQLVVEQ